MQANWVSSLAGRWCTFAVSVLIIVEIERYRWHRSWIRRVARVTSVIAVFHGGCWKKSNLLPWVNRVHGVLRRTRWLSTYLDAYLAVADTRYDTRQLGTRSLVQNREKKTRRLWKIDFNFPFTWNLYIFCVIGLFDACDATYRTFSKISV